MERIPPHYHLPVGIQAECRGGFALYSLAAMPEPLLPSDEVV
jgi:hypothetical protein